MFKKIPSFQDERLSGKETKSHYKIFDIDQAAAFFVSIMPGLSDKLVRRLELADELLRQNSCVQEALGTNVGLKIVGVSGDTVEVALCDLEGDKVDLGYRIENPDTAFPEYYEEHESESYDNEQIALKRRVLYYALTTGAGLVVNPYRMWQYTIKD